MRLPTQHSRIENAAIPASYPMWLRKIFGELHARWAVTT